MAIRHFRMLVPDNQMGRKKLEVVLPPIDADPEEVVRDLFQQRWVEDLEPATEPATWAV